jgi:hypothetical protein
MKLAMTAAALLLSCGSAFAGNFALLSMQYSADQFVPHIRYDGIIAPGDAKALASLLERTLGCDETCTGSSAVLTFNSVGGDFVEAQAMARLLATRHVATVIEADQSCYGACTIAFTGGSALGSDGAIVPDRTVVPGARIAVSNFNQPHEGLAQAILAHGIDKVLGGTPAELEALAVSGQWGVSSSISPFLNGMMEGGLDLTNPEGLFLLGARLPAIPRADIEPAQDIAVLNACSYLIARHEQQTPGDMFEQPDPGFIQSLPAKTKGEALMGFSVSDMDDFNFCGTPASSSPFESIGLYTQDGDGIRMVDSQQVELFMLLDPYTRLSELETVFAPYIEDAHFESSGMISLTGDGEGMSRAQLGVQTLYQDKYRRISSAGDLMVYEQSGGTGLFEGAVAFMKGPAIAEPSLSASPNITTLSGTYADSGNGIAMMAFDGSNDAVMRIELGKPWGELTAQEWTFVAQFECGLVIANLNLECE